MNRSGLNVERTCVGSSDGSSIIFFSFFFSTFYSSSFVSLVPGVWFWLQGRGRGGKPPVEGEETKYAPFAIFTPSTH